VTGRDQTNWGAFLFPRAAQSVSELLRSPCHQSSEVQKGEPTVVAEVGGETGGVRRWWGRCRLTGRQINRSSGGGAQIELGFQGL
jgi:hypothetical protein